MVDNTESPTYYEKWRNTESPTYYEKWRKKQLVDFLKFADLNFPKEMAEIYYAFDEMRRGN